jgi:hypothetical protein
MSDWYFMEQQGRYRQEQLRGEAAQRDIFALVPHLGFREQVAGALISAALRLAPTASAVRLEIVNAQLNCERSLTGIVGS